MIFLAPSPEQIIIICQQMTMFIQYLQESKTDLDDTSIRELDSLKNKYKAVFMSSQKGSSQPNITDESSYETAIPINFQRKDKKARLTPTESTLDPQSYEPLYGDNAITPHAMSIVSLVCDYQNQRKIGVKAILDKVKHPISGTELQLWDSRGQFCHFIKNIIVHFTNYNLKDQATLKSISELISFIRSVRNDSGLFQPSSANSMRQLLARIDSHLGEIETIIQIQLTFISAREQTEKLNEQMLMVFYHGIDIAMRAIAKYEPDPKANLKTITNPVQKIKGYIGTENIPLLNKYIITLASIYPKDGETNSISNNEYIFTYKNSTWRSTNLSSLTNDPSVVQYDVNIFNSYMKFLALLEQLAINARHAALSYKLAGETGNWGIYYQMGESTSQLCNIIGLTH